MKILECVPNFSEGQNRQTIDAIADALQRVSGVRLLDICTDADHNRTVFTFVGSPDGIEKAAAAACDRALALIDMRAQRGVHPRIGAVDVVPFIPLKNAVMADAVETARRFGRAFAQRNGLPVYFYGEAALVEEHRELPHIRRGGYEGLEKRMKDPDWAPDAGPSVLNERSGATAVGARDFLVAYNVNLASAELGCLTEMLVIVAVPPQLRVTVKSPVVRLPSRSPTLTGLWLLMPFALVYTRSLKITLAE